MIKPLPPLKWLWRLHPLLKLDHLVSLNGLDSYIIYQHQLLGINLDQMMEYKTTSEELEATFDPIANFIMMNFVMMLQL